MEYEYKFIRIERAYWGGSFKEDYREIVNAHAEEGWELMQLFAPPLATPGIASYCDVILKRKKQKNT